MRPSVLIVPFCLAAALLVTGGEQRAEAIIGGSTISPSALQPAGEYGWLARLEGPGSDCTGSLVAADWVLTGAHCIPVTTAYFGADKLSPIDVVETYVHPAYDESTFESTFDIALLRLAENPGRDPIAMASAGSSLPTGGVVTLAGWGVTSVSGSAPSLPSEVPSELVQVTSSEWVTGADGMSCFGDSGGPMLRNGELAGVISAGDAACAEFTIGPRVSALRSFIDSTLGTGGGQPPVALSGEVSVSIGEPVEIPFDFSDPDTPTEQLQITAADFGVLSFDSCTETSPAVCTFFAPEGFVGDTTVTYTVSDGSNEATAVWIVHVIDVPSPPVADNGETLVTVDRPQEIGLSAFDANGDDLTFAIVSPPAHGDLSDCSTGNCVYTPDPAYIGDDEFTFTASDGESTSNTATFSITVIAQQPPFTVDSTETTTAGALLEFFLNAGDLNGDELTYQLVSLPQHGDVSCDLAFCTYLPDPNFVGDDALTFTASDGSSTSNISTVTIQVLASEPPTATDQDGFTKGGVLSVGLAGSDPEGAPLTFTIVTPPAHGTLTDCTGGSCTYTPDPGFVGADPFEWTVSDGETTVGATYTVHVLAPTWNVRPLSGSGTAQLLAEIVAGHEGAVTNAVLVGSPAAAGTFVDPTSATSITSGVVLSNGPASEVSGPALASAAASDLSLPGDTEVSEAAGVETVDATRLEFDLTATDGLIALDVVFASREYGFSEGTEFNDTAIVVIDGQPCLLPGNHPLSVNGVNQGGLDSSPVNEDLFVGNFDLTASIDASGFTTGIQCTASVTPGATVRVELAIADGVDGSIASYLLIAGEVPDTPPTIDMATSAGGTEGTPLQLNAAVTDDGAVELSWAYEAVTADDGAICVFDDSSVAAPTLTCSDEGTFSVTLSADDGVNEPVVATTTVTVDNAVPQLAVVAPSGASRFFIGLPVGFSIDVSDAGVDDVLTCTIDVGDGSAIVTGAVVDGVCATQHGYTATGLVTVVVTVDDGDGGVATAEFDVAVGTKKAVVVGAIRAEIDDETFRFGTVLIGDQVQVVAADGTGEFVGEQLLSVATDGPIVRYTVAGEWMGTAGFTAEIVVTDGGATRLDAVTVTIRDSDGAVVHVIEFEAEHGQLVVARLLRRGSPDV